MIYKHLLRPLLFLFPAETAHQMTIGLMHALSVIPGGCALLRGALQYTDDTIAVRTLGQTFPNPIGLAAGLDKDAEAFDVFGALGFGFVEVGTLTAQAQPGNPQPRLFRLPLDRALINRMGFNNLGAQHAARRLAGRVPGRTVLGINLGKTKTAPDIEAAEDYARGAVLLAPHADYLAINVSSPNTPGLRDFQAVERLKPLLVRIREAVEQASPQRKVPLLVKIAPDLSDLEIDAVAELALDLRLDGIIATNTTVAREGLATDPSVVTAYGLGGLSGAPLKARATAVIRRLRARVSDRVTLVSVGGIETVDDIWDRIVSGATLVQIYTALIYEGPRLPAVLARGLADRVRRAGLRNITEAIGSAL